MSKLKDLWDLSRGARDAFFLIGLLLAALVWSLDAFRNVGSIPALAAENRIFDKRLTVVEAKLEFLVLGMEKLTKTRYTSSNGIDHHTRRSP